jgi:hypothetical protein
MTVPRTGGKDEGERYEVRATDGYGRDILVGYTNRAGGGDLVVMVNRHPVWHSPRLIDRHVVPIAKAREKTA